MDLAGGPDGSIIKEYIAVIQKHQPCSLLVNYNAPIQFFFPRLIPIGLEILGVEASTCVGYQDCEDCCFTLSYVKIFVYKMYLQIAFF